MRFPRAPYYPTSQPLHLGPGDECRTYGSVARPPAQPYVVLDAERSSTRTRAALDMEASDEKPKLQTYLNRKLKKNETGDGSTMQM